MKCNQGVKDKCFFQGWNHNVVNAYKMFAARIKTVTQREVAVNVEGCSQNFFWNVKQELSQITAGCRAGLESKL